MQSSNLERTTSPAPVSASERVRFSVYGGRIDVRTNDPDTAGWVRDHLPFGAGPGADGEPDVVLRVVREPGGGPGAERYRLTADGEPVVEIADRHRFLERLEQELHFAAAASARTRAFVHAGAVLVDGEVVLIPGRSGTGKTSLVAALIRAGAMYLSDEYAVIDRHGRVHPYPRPLRIRTSGGRVSRPVEWWDGGVAQEPARASTILVTRFCPGARWRPEEIGRAEAMLELFSNAVTARTRSSVVLSALRKAVEGTGAYRGMRGESDQIVRWLGLPEQESKRARKRP